MRSAFCKHTHTKVAEALSKHSKGQETFPFQKQEVLHATCGSPEDNGAAVAQIGASEWTHKCLWMCTKFRIDCKETLSPVQPGYT